MGSVIPSHQWLIGGGHCTCLRSASGWVSKDYRVASLDRASTGSRCGIGKGSVRACHGHNVSQFQKSAESETSDFYFGNPPFHGQLFKCISLPAPMP